MNDQMTQVEPMDAAKNNSKIVESLADVSTVIMDKEIKCYWNDAEFEDGSKVCDNGVAYNCNMGYWIKQDSGC
jgi:hypothetical protein